MPAMGKRFAAIQGIISHYLNIKGVLCIYIGWNCGFVGQTMGSPSLQDTKEYPDSPVEAAAPTVESTVPVESQDTMLSHHEDGQGPDSAPPSGAVEVESGVAGGEGEPETGSASASDPKAVEAFNWQQLSILPKSYCANCKRAMDPAVSKVVRKKGHQGFTCRACHNLTTMLYRRVDMSKVGFKDLSLEQTTEFFQRAGKMETHHGLLNWSKVKGLLVDKLTEVELHRQKVKVSGKFLPLSVYETKGYDTKVIEATAEWQKSDMPLAVFVKVLVLSWFYPNHLKRVYIYIYLLYIYTLISFNLLIMVHESGER